MCYLSINSHILLVTIMYNFGQIIHELLDNKLMI